MQKGVNKVILVGNLGQDPEMRSTSGGTSVANIRIATSETWKDKQTQEQKERTEWHSVVFFGNLADIVGQYLKKGRQVYVEGQLRTRKWQGKDGSDRYTTEVVASEMQMLGGRQNDSGSNGPAQQQNNNTGNGGSNANQGGNADVPPDLDDDDIPF